MYPLRPSDQTPLELLLASRSDKDAPSHPKHHSVLKLGTDLHLLKQSLALCGGVLGRELGAQLASCLDDFQFNRCHGSPSLVHNEPCAPATGIG